MRGQISFEYLLVSVVALFLLSISTASLINIKEFSDVSIEKAQFKSSATKLTNTIAEVCALGSGNRRTIFLKSLLSVDYYDGIVQVTNSSTITAPIACEVISEKNLQGSVVIENNNGKIKIK
ncbi:hypothetical protein KKE92_04480 [Candidatus Micrarchaeota archaeon]|nr:hypothetical protein [Candidatus Micrarchaeota archaeon]MBU1681921.1 hypothetical protein [Candidatus Micrarchaeota archaeon]